MHELFMLKTRRLWILLLLMRCGWVLLFWADYWQNGWDYRLWLVLLTGICAQCNMDQTRKHSWSAERFVGPRLNVAPLHHWFKIKVKSLLKRSVVYRQCSHPYFCNRFGGLVFGLTFTGIRLFSELSLLPLFSLDSHSVFQVPCLLLKSWKNGRIKFLSR